MGEIVKCYNKISVNCLLNVIFIVKYCRMYGFGSKKYVFYYNSLYNTLCTVGLT